jgi:putative aldouronate transport system permease protein
MREYYTPARCVFLTILGIFFTGLCLACLIPFIHVMALSFSHKVPATKYLVKLLPLDFNEDTKIIHTGLNLSSYAFVLTKPEFVSSFIVSLKRVVLSSILTMSTIILAAYPLSKTKQEFTGRTVYTWFIVMTMLLSGGLVPWYMVIKTTGLLDTIWALVIPGMAPAYSIVLLLNFFRSVPKSLEESAFLDGAGYYTILWRIYIPLSLPSIVTLLLFTIVGNWNAWFDGLILMQLPSNYPLQSYLQTLIESTSSTIFQRARAELLKQISDRTVKAAQIFIGALPMLLLYPFLQRYFMMGIVLGSVKE